MLQFAVGGTDVAQRPSTKIVLAASPERATHAAAELCEHGPLLMKPYEPKIVVECIKRLLAARERQGGKVC